MLLLSLQTHLQLQKKTLTYNVSYSDLKCNSFFFYKFSPNILNGRFDETRARSKQSL